MYSTNMYKTFVTVTELKLQMPYLTIFAILATRLKICQYDKLYFKWYKYIQEINH